MNLNVYSNIPPNSLHFLHLRFCVAKVDNVSPFFSPKLESEGEYGVYIDNGDLLPRVMSLCFE